MTQYWLKFTLESDTTLGRGDGVAGLVDAEVQHDEYGCPYLTGRALKGLLSEECANLLFALSRKGADRLWLQAAQRLFGNPGSAHANRSHLTIGNAQLPEDLRQAIVVNVVENRLTREQVLDSLTGIRWQTRVDAKTGAPQDETLRALRVILRKTRFEAALYFVARSVVGEAAVTDQDLALLAACVKALRRIGTGRNRGRGALQVRLYNQQDEDVTEQHFAQFESEVLACIA